MNGPVTLLTGYVTFSNLLHLNKLSFFLYEIDKSRAPIIHKVVAGIKWDSICKVLSTVNWYRISIQQTLAIDIVTGLLLNEDGDTNIYCMHANICSILNYYITAI